MSSPGPSKDDGAQKSPPTAPLNADAIKSKKDAEQLRKCQELLSKLESTFTTIMTGVLKRYSQYVVHPFKVLLECPICTELIIEAMTRKCGHNFCNYCLTKWLQSSNDCPICRNQVPFASKNHLIDETIKLLVEISFTKEEKTERGERIQQRSATASSLLGYDHQISNAFANLLTDGVDADLKQKQEEAFLMVGRSNCVQSAKLVIQELFKVSDLCSKLRGQEDFRPVLSLIISFSNDFASLYPALRALPESYFDGDISM